MSSNFDAATADRVAKLVRLLSSDNPAEVAAATAALKRVLLHAGLDFHFLAARLTTATGGSNLHANRQQTHAAYATGYQAGLEAAQARTAQRDRDAYAKGFNDGRAAAQAAAAAKSRPPDDSATNDWSSFAAALLKASSRWSDRERGFLEEMVIWGRVREPSPKQSAWMQSLAGRAEKWRRAGGARRK